MMTVGCAGFAVPATRYFKELRFVEVPESYVSTPSAGTIRRWRREAPEGFVFAVQAPKEIGAEGFRPGKAVDAAVKNVVEIARELESRITVFSAPADFSPTKTNKAMVKELLGGLRKKLPQIVLDLPAWDPDDASALAADSGAVATRDPLAAGLAKGAFAYYRLPGPAGHKSRYEEPALEKLAALASEGANEHAIYVFANVDGFTDAGRLQKVLEGG